MSRIMQHDTISEAGEKPLLKGMRGVASIRKIVRTRSKGKIKGGKSRWKSLLSPRVFKTKNKAGDFGSS
jgi:hypothetical protein